MTAPAPVSDAAKATVLRTLLRDGPTPSRRFHRGVGCHGSWLAALRACIASRLATWVPREVGVVRATMLAPLWLQAYARREAPPPWATDRRPLWKRVLEAREAERRVRGARRRAEQRARAAASATARNC